MNIYCCNCKKYISGKLIRGKVIYPTRPDLATIPFWQCPTCNGYVGCHYKTNTPTAPLGCIPTPAIKKYRTKIHNLIDPLWKGYKGRTKNKARRIIYGDISKFLGYDFHAAKIRSSEEAMKIFNYVNQQEVQNKWQNVIRKL